MYDNDMMLYGHFRTSIFFKTLILVPEHVQELS